MRSYTTLFALLLGSTISHASSITCAEIQSAAQQKKIKFTDFKTEKNREFQFQYLLFKKANELSLKGADQDYHQRHMSMEELIERLDPLLYNVKIGNTEFHSVNFDVGGGTSVEYLFDLDTAKYSGIMRDESSLFVDSKNCDIEPETFSRD